MEERPFSTVVGPDGRTLAVSGSVDELAVDDFSRALQQCVNGSSDAVVVDLSDVDFLPSMGIAVLVRAMKPDGGSVTIVARRGCFAARVLTLCCIPFEHLDEVPQSSVS